MEPQAEEHISGDDSCEGILGRCCRQLPCEAVCDVDASGEQHPLEVLDAPQSAHLDDAPPRVLGWYW